MSSAGHIYLNIMMIFTVVGEGHWFVEIYWENCVCVWRNILLFVSVEDLTVVSVSLA